MNGNAIGLIETQGLVGLINAVDAMLKAASVELASSIIKYFWDEKTRIWRDGWDAKKREPVDQISQHMCTLAILLGLKREARNKLARDVLIKGAKQRKNV